LEAAPLAVDLVPVPEAHGRVAAEDVHAPAAVPHFARPAMDGYLCHDADVRDASPGRPAVLPITGAARMGERPGHGPARGEAWVITTGAAMPGAGTGCCRWRPSAARGIGYGLSGRLGSPTSRPPAS